MLCPHCASPVKASARKCRHCGEWLVEARGRPGAGGFARGSADARAVARGIKKKEADEFLVRCGVVAMFAATGIVWYWTGSRSAAAAVFAPLFCLLAWWYRRE